MKYLILIISLLLSTLISLGQTKNPKKITINIRVGQNINWPSNISLNDAKKYNLVEYPNFFKSDLLTLTFDIKNKKYYKEGKEDISLYSILSFKKNEYGYYFELSIPEKDVSSKILLTEKEEGGYVLIVQYSSNFSDERLEGYFTESQDMDIIYEY